MGQQGHSLTARSAGRLPHVNDNQQALAAEVRAEMGRQNIKAAPIQRALGISSTAWGTYFVQCTRDVPMSVVVSVAEFLGLAPSELLRRAELAQPAATLEQHITRQLSPEAQEQVRKAKAQVTERPTRRRTNG